MQDAEFFDKANCRLPALRVDTWHGWVFINFDESATPLSEYVDIFEEDFAYLQQDNCRLAITTVNDVECNWKLAVENVIDMYHLNIVHKSTNGREFTLEGYEFSPRDRGGYMATFNSGPSTLTGKPVFGRMPWLADKPDNFSTTGRLRPNFVLFARIDDVHASVMWPLSPTRTRIIVYTLLPKIYFSEPEFAERVKAYQDYQNKVISEDSAVLQMMQQGITSSRYAPGRMALVETGVHHVSNDNLTRLRAVLENPSKGVQP
jgi:Rieske 2Fe-2S family protein